MGNAQATQDLPAGNFLKDAREPLLSLLDRLEEEEDLVPLDESGGNWARSFLGPSAKPQSRRGGPPKFPSGKNSVTYRGVLPNNLLHDFADVSEDGHDVMRPEDVTGTTVVAIKRLKLGKENSGRDGYWNEVAILGKVKHPNVVKLLGYCTEGGEAMLIYEFMVGGNLAQALFHAPTNKEPPPPVLSLEQRIRIALDAARGLACLHEQGIVHRDLRPTNILLDEDLRAKIASLGLAKVTKCAGPKPRVSLEHQPVIGRIGYICPAYLETGHVTPKTDLFSFGVILLQLLAGRPFLQSEETGKPLSLVEVIERPSLGVVPMDPTQGPGEDVDEGTAKIAESFAQRAQLAKLEEEFADERRRMGLANWVDSAKVKPEMDPEPDVESEVERDIKPAKAGGYARLTSDESRKQNSKGLSNAYERVSEERGGRAEAEDEDVVDRITTFATFVDPRLQGKYDEILAKGIALLAVRCVQDIPSLRPSASDVMKELQLFLGEVANQ